MATDGWLNEANTPVIGSSNDKNYGPSRIVGPSSQGLPANDIESFAEENPAVPSSNSQEHINQMFLNARANGGRFNHG
jgi:hypothetical protein